MVGIRSRGAVPITTARSKGPTLAPISVTQANDSIRSRSDGRRVVGLYAEAVGNYQTVG
jgi:hypothetical protein